jgi:malonyl-CoA/methylmalonyl-CoA synthetase
MPIPFLRLLQESFAKHATRPALVHQSETWTYAKLGERIQGVAGLFKKMGLAPGDRVAVCTASKLSFLIAHLATLHAGAVSLPLNHRFTREELRFFLSDSEASVAIVGDANTAITSALRAEMPNLRQWMSDAEILGTNPDGLSPAAVAENDPCLLIYSSGTTGWPKGIVHTHGNTASALLALKVCWRFTADDVVLNVLPLFHVHGLCFATLLTLISGGCVILDEFEPQKTMERIKDCSVFMAVPTIYYRLLEQPNFRERAKTWTRTRLFTCGSAPIRPEVLPELESILGKPVINRYGMTEAFVITSLPLDGPWPNGSVGIPLDGVEVRVVDESGASGSGVGSVQIRGPNLFREYWNKPDATRDAFASGWFDTGDLGQRDESGFLTLVGRKNDLIITSGFNVYPQVVERVINECPGVRESAVFGVPDDRKGERVVAVVVRDDPLLDEEHLRAFWSERLVDYQRPKAVKFIDALPRNAMGKVLRRELKDLMAETP